MSYSGSRGTEQDLEQILEYYNAGGEKDRLTRGIGVIEWERSKVIISRYLSGNKQVIYDVGGGTGVYSRWLAELGHEVHLLELSPAAVEYARNLQQEENTFPLHSIEVADARQLLRPDESADLVLLMGPLYHLTAREERIAAIREAARVLKPGGILIAAGISRFSSTLWGLSVFGAKNEFIDDSVFFGMIRRELTDGQHIRPEEYPHFISRAYFHLPSELKSELTDAGLTHLSTAAVEGPVWIVPAFSEKWNDPGSREALMQISSLVEEQESLLGMSPHMLAIARK
ncbi:class I SAM-dependent methyltransferase [Paenibacillus ihuae]|uniref:class I SAM-dependent methyltransferase n=1 Tax=Paenibacillus ihuae TaxID=1232431 RepID=UPI0006D54832|nr:class I SAM-dependent methyltransferase [Paenibacillus ihuae]